MKTRMQNLFSAVALLMAVGSVAQASTFYSNEATFDAAVSGVTDVTFGGIVNDSAVPPNPTGYTSYALGKTTVGGLQFAVGPASPSGILFAIGAAYYGFGAASLSSQDPGPVGTNDFLVTLPSAVTALGFDYIVDPGTVTVKLSDGTVDSLTASGTPTSGFFGVTSATGFTSVDITELFSPASESINLTEFTYGTTRASTSPAVPEPDSLLLVFTGLAGVAGALKTKLLRRS
jgi:hypothetical protein